MAGLQATEGRDDLAIEHLTEAIRIDPTYADAHLNMARLLARHGEVERAKAHVAEAQRIAMDQGDTRAER